MSPRNIFVAVVLAVALAAGLAVATRLSAPAEVKTALVLPTSNALPEFQLLDALGNTVNRETFLDQWSLVFFGFTHCPDICPLTLQTLAAAQRDLAAAGQQPLPQIVLISVDPERDTPQLIGQYVAHFGDGNLGVTGSLDELKKLTAALGIYFQKQPGDADSYAVDHSAAVLLINPNGEFHALFSGPHVAANYVHDLPIIMENF
ncbi:MAG: SCO family protein [Woeseiaceae bacterium]